MAEIDIFSLGDNYTSIYEGIFENNDFFQFETKFIVQIIFIAFLMLMGTLGNLSLLVSVCSSPRLRNPANILLTNLALGDLIYLFVAAPFYIEHVIHPYWQYPELLCKLRHFGQLTAQGICVYSLTALSAERYMVLAGQTIMRGRNNKYRRVMATVFVWIISVIVSLPVIFLANLKEVRCLPYPYDNHMTKIYECVRFALYYALPLTAICCCYVLIANTLLTSTGHFRQESQPGVQHFRARKRLALIVVVIAFFFGIFWFPYHLIPLIVAFNPNATASSDAYHVIYSLAALTNSALNPWIVYIMSSTHRAVLMEVFFRRLRQRQTSTINCKTKTDEFVPLKKIKQYTPDSKLTSVSSI